MKQLITKTTRIDKSSGRHTIIDHICTNPELKLIKTVGTFIGVSDHVGTYMKINMKKPVEELKVIKCRSYKRYNIEDYNEALKYNLAHSNINDHINNKDSNSATEELIKIMQTTADEHAPMKEIKINSKDDSVPWYNKALEDMIAQKRSLVADFYYYGSQSFKERLNQVSNSINHLKRKLKKKYVTEKFSEAQGDAKKCWNLLNRITNRQRTRDVTEPEMLDQEKVNDINSYFATVGLEIQKKLNLRPPELNIAGLGGFSFKPETESSVEKLIDKLKSDVATGQDEIGAKLIKDAKTTLSPILTRIINIGYETSTFPDCMKTAIIKALHKKDDPDDITNYRPISILPTLSKLLERAPTDQIVEYMEINNLLTRNQHAYRKGHSTQTCLVEVVNHLYKLIDKKKYTAIASLDLSKAFDSISHSLIIQKLSNLNMSESTLEWVKSYLSNRKQRTKFSSYMSSEAAVTSGVPQGSIIGPLLFLCFTNDLSNEFEGKCKMVAYADDTQLIVDGDSLSQLLTKIEEMLTIAQKWYAANSMKNNIGKTEVLIINTRKANLKDVNIRIKDEGRVITLEPQTHIKILGVIIDDQLNWNRQVNNTKKKAMNATRNVHRINHLLPIKERVNLYNALITPHLDYADVVWGGCGTTNSNKLQLVQNFAAKSITGNKKRDSATKSLKKLKFLKLNQRRTVHETVFIHKSLLNINPANINEDYSQQKPTGNTRRAHQGKLNLPTHQSSKYQNSPFYRTIKSWNSCPSSFPADNPKTHKSHFQKYLINQTYKI